MEGDDADQKLAATLQAIASEFRRIEEDCIHSGKAHFNASARWNRYNYLLGIPSVVLSAAAGAAFFKDYPIVAGAMATTVSVLTGLMTFLKPSKIAGAHKNSGDQYLSLGNDARVFREIQLPQATTAQAATEAISSFTSRRNELNQASLQFSRGDFLKARKGISQGEATHAVDNGGV